MDVVKIRRRYRLLAGRYDWLIRRPTQRLRREAVAHLALQKGECILDLGCGTGLSLPFLCEAVGETGKVYGVEVSPEMLQIARRRVEQEGLRNVMLLKASAESFQLEDPVDALLCFYTHDIMLSPTALPRAMRWLKPGARIVAAGGKLARGPIGGLINPLTILYSLPFITTLDLSREPFAGLRDLLPDLRVEDRMLGSQYLAWGRRPTFR